MVVKSREFFCLLLFDFFNLVFRIFFDSFSVAIVAEERFAFFTPVMIFLFSASDFAVEAIPNLSVVSNSVLSDQSVAVIAGDSLACISLNFLVWRNQRGFNKAIFPEFLMEAIQAKIEFALITVIELLTLLWESCGALSACVFLI